MRKTLLFLTAILLLSTIFSCQKEVNGDITGSPTNGGGSGTGAGNMKAKINGVQWIATHFATASKYSGLINITGRSTDGKLITITLTDSGVHRYTLDENSPHAGAYADSASGNVIAYTTNQGNNPGDGGGEVNITSINTSNKTMSGTFSFKVFRQADGAQLTMTEGSFTNIVYATSQPVANATDTFRVKIDGVLWNPPTIFAVPAIGKMIISGTDATGTKSVSVQFPESTLPGNYTFDFFAQVYVGMYNADATTSKLADSGTLTILEYNTTTRRIRGNFNFVATPLITTGSSNLTEGYFSVKY